MAVCVGCGMVVNNGILEVEICPDSCLGCATADNPSPSGCTSGIYLALCENGGISCASAGSPSPDGCTSGLYVAVGCGIENVNGTLQADVGDAATCAPVVQNLLTCVDGDGLRADHQFSIAGNSLICGHDSSFLDAIPIDQPGINLAAQAAPYSFFTPIVVVNPPCTGLSWTGNTLYDVGGLQVEAAANSLAEITFRLHQGNAGDPVAYGGLNPSYRITIDNRFSANPQRQDVVLHDTTFQQFADGGAQFGLRLDITVVQGSVELYAFTGQQWEITWHYTHRTPIGTDDTSLFGCESPVTP